MLNHHQQGHLLHPIESTLNGFHHHGRTFDVKGVCGNGNDFRPIIDGSLDVNGAVEKSHHLHPDMEMQSGSSVSETDFAVHCIIKSPSKTNLNSPSTPKRIYAIDGKVSKSQLTPIKTGLFQVKVTNTYKLHTYSAYQGF